MAMQVSSKRRRTLKSTLSSSSASPSSLAGAVLEELRPPLDDAAGDAAAAAAADSPRMPPLVEAIRLWKVPFRRTRDRDKKLLHTSTSLQKNPLARFLRAIFFPCSCCKNSLAGGSFVFCMTSSGIRHRCVSSFQTASPWILARLLRGKKIRPGNPVINHSSNFIKAVAEIAKAAVNKQ